MILGPSSVIVLLALGAGEPTSGGRPARPEPGGALATLEAEHADLFARVAPSVVLLVSDGTSGSGFVVGRDGLVLTNAHVVGEAREVAVHLLDGRHGRGSVVARATGSLDLALVKIPFTDLAPLEAGWLEAVRAGTFAATVGHGGGAAWTFSTGLVSNPRPLGDGAPLILAQMALRPGSSGGPLVDRRGRALAVVTAGTKNASGVTFAIRIDAAAQAFPELAGWAAPPYAEGAAPEPSSARRVAAPEVAAASPPPAGEPLAVAPLEPSRPVSVARFSASGPAPGGWDPSQAPSPSGKLVTVWQAPRERRPGRPTAPIRPPIAPRQAEVPVASTRPDSTPSTLAIGTAPSPSVEPSTAAVHEPAASLAVIFAAAAVALAAALLAAILPHR